MDRDVRGPATVVEAWACRVLTPDDPEVWLRWTAVQGGSGRYDTARRSLQRYFELAGPAGESDPRALEMKEALTQLLPGGSLVQQGLRVRPRRGK